ncbi:MAG: transposase [Candidatus Riflebacteria bacterium]
MFQIKDEKQVRRRFTKEFKQDAVKMITEQGHSIAEVAKNLGINYNLFAAGKRNFQTIALSKLMP